MHTTVAVKFYPSEETLDQDTPELKLMDGLRHPNIVAIFGISKDRPGSECNKCSFPCIILASFVLDVLRFGTRIY